MNVLFVGKSSDIREIFQITRKFTIEKSYNTACRIYSSITREISVQEKGHMNVLVLFLGKSSDIQEIVQNKKICDRVKSQ